MSAANPTLRDIHEYILVFSKDAFGRKNPQKRPSTISRDEFLEYTKSVWTFPAESAGGLDTPPRSRRSYRAGALRCTPTPMT